MPVAACRPTGMLLCRSLLALVGCRSVHRWPAFLSLPCRKDAVDVDGYLQSHQVSRGVCGACSCAKHTGAAATRVQPAPAVVGQLLPTLPALRGCLAHIAHLPCIQEYP